MAKKLGNVKHIILVLSGKGGVGKSTVTTQLACALEKLGSKVGVLDIDLTGPSIPRMFGLQDKKVHQSPSGWIPVYTNPSATLSVMSIGFLIQNKDDAIVWRGPKKNAMINQFLDDVEWGEIDYLIIDTPPGTSDEHMAIMKGLEEYNPDGAIIVTTPQEVSLNDVRKEISFCKTVGLPIIGVIENMSGYICPNCSNCTNIFSKGGGERLSEEYGLEFLGSLPIDGELTSLIEETGNIQLHFHESLVYPIVMQITNKVVDLVKK